ncbi:uncharacterized protein LOC124275109 [Haliotis rubra]|uniref:uncharacterized protein LOC124275109 n=1 Tax=Haliotis rubra TaxID=36100 RepID=UPI001EE53168|nr:uncharacterized protein LOC124275109 [Haliotis rubra]
MDVIKSSTKVVAHECRTLCRKSTQSLLMLKTHDDIMNFTWEKFYHELTARCPGLCSILSAIVSDVPIQATSKAFRHMLMTAAVGLHGRSQDMSALQYISGFLLTHGGCTQKAIQRLSQIGFTMHPVTLHQKLLSWESELSSEIKDMKNEWAAGGQKKYQLIGDNWDKNILPSYRTSDRKTVSLHLFNMYAIVDRICPQPSASYTKVINAIDLDCLTFIPSKEEQALLLREMTFLFSTSVIANHPELNSKFGKIFPQHLPHEYSHLAGIKTSQYPLGLFDCNENKTQDVIKLLTDLTEEYVPFADGEIVESVFLGGDRLTDERVQCAQQSVGNGLTPKDRLEGFISKIEDFHRLMNLLEAIHKMSYSTKSGNDKGTVYFFRNLLNMRNVKGDVKNAYRPFKILYYIILDAICLLLFLHHLHLDDPDTKISFPDNFTDLSAGERVQWLNDISEEIIKEWFFEDSEDICESLRRVLSNPEHQENYWVSNLDEGRVKCHFCEKTYAYIGSLKAHEAKFHNVNIQKKKPKSKTKKSDQLKDHLLMVFKLTMLHKNLDQAVDMADGCRSVRSAKYELPLYNKTNKVKYVIGSVHLTALTSGTLPAEQSERLVANRFVNLQGGKNNNIALDEYLEMLNRDSKIACSGHKTKESIIQHSKEYPHLTQSVRNFEDICNLKQRKGFHHLPNYGADVHKVLSELRQLDVLTTKPERSLHCKDLCSDRNPFANSESNLSTMIHRHKPTVPFARLRNKHI